MAVLLLTAPPPGWSGIEIYFGMSGWPCYKKIEAAGQPYEHFLAKRYNLKVESKEEEKKDEVDEEDQSKSEEYQKKKKKKILTTDDYYELLGLSHLRWKATTKDIRDAYRKAVLLYHPDKNVGIDDTIFKKVQVAYDTLSNEQKRKTFDSQEADVSIPTSVPFDSDFYKTFGIVFERFAKWSINPKVPPLGDPKTTYSEVQKFYDFWYSFRSWRDFSFNDEYDLEDAESRDERRWMERQNKKTRDKLKKDEKSRITKLTETAYGLDPRIKKFKEEQEAERQRKKEAREDAARRKKEQQERKELAEREKKQAEEQARADEVKRIAREKDQVKRDLQNKRKKLREYCLDLKGVTPVDVESLCLNLDHSRTTALVQTLDGAANDKERIRLAVRAELDHIKQAQNAQERKAKSDAEGKKEAREAKPWTSEELSQLARALTKVPAGSQNRWQSVAELIPTRTLNEVIAKAQSAKNSRPQELQKKKDVEAKDAYQASLVHKRERDGKPVDEITIRYDMEGASSSAGEVQEVPSQIPSGAAVQTATTGAPKAKAKSSKAAPPTQTQTTATATAPASAPASAPAPAPTQPTTSEVDSSVTDWSSEQQKALERALAKFPSSLGPERWDRISSEVPGKSKRDCVARFKYLANLIKIKKAL
eukprot:TRINITY_DN14905_c0_g1_i1.p1 TRINITY_DN14905_c0_g1~~TRINITY_DN14905_c0_g1_i1.p1  ORF type:complete len:665 (+),score=167.75 TRINITY_DN14905_c0_g1_i1:48-1997(+)